MRAAAAWAGRNSPMASADRAPATRRRHRMRAFVAARRRRVDARARGPVPSRSDAGKDARVPAAPKPTGAGGGRTSGRAAGTTGPSRPGTGSEDRAPAAPKPRCRSSFSRSASSPRSSSPVMRPRSSTSTRSASSAMKSRFCSTSRIDSPRDSSSRERIRAISSMIEGWMPSVGSSSRRSSGLAVRQRASARSCCSPPESISPFRSRSGSSRGKSASSASSAASSSPSPWSGRAKWRFSRTDSRGKIPRPWGT